MGMNFSKDFLFWTKVILYLCCFLLITGINGCVQNKIFDFFDTLNHYRAIEKRYNQIMDIVPRQYRAEVEQISEKYQVPVLFFVRVVYHESRWNPRAKSKVNANGSYDAGLCQLNSYNFPYFRRIFSNFDPWNPRLNLEVGAWFLRQMYNQHGNWFAALAAYNAGSYSVRSGRLPNSTKRYLAAVKKSLQPINKGV